MPFVLDASVTINWAMPDESHPMADLALQQLRRDESAIVPGIWWYEVRNILVLNERRNRITETDSMQFLRELRGFDIKIEHSLTDADVLYFARRHCLSIYDAAYLFLAFHEQLPIATLDKALQSAAMAAGISLLS
jgi:predicted nucleic acid-binding protein